ncbi:hypothetical protein BUALT_Bualt14G0053100 [Buddleja alternifolia]|uniref:Uncharacterized protein n=1 Tax=Buddleja alternifolia TaxID=168488 RepID=A0AAV6WH20_9LAMI|nr:hypothetical protein BUALT_Bualt14G0053100 [Buddleja alternifolia]
MSPNPWTLCSITKLLPWMHVGSFEIPSGSLTVFFVAANLISLAVYDRVIIPLCKKFRGKPGFTNLQRIGIGLFLSTLGMASAALAETKRLAKAKEVGQNATMNISPKGMKTMSTGVFLTTLPLGFLMSSLLVSVVKTVTTDDDGKGWVGDRINNGRLDCFYGLLAILSFIDFWLFLLSAKWCKITPRNV